MGEPQGVDQWIVAYTSGAWLVEVPRATSAAGCEDEDGGWLAGGGGWGKEQGVDCIISAECCLFDRNFCARTTSVARSSQHHRLISIGWRRNGQDEWDMSRYRQRWRLHLLLSRFVHKGYGNGGVLGPSDTAQFVSDEKLSVLLVFLYDCVVAHINSRGNFALNDRSLNHFKLEIGRSPISAR
ncbi:hypothetical protein FB451DRAFT_1184106 [Mycena latifolia]|nr:hypothetical protein FB451DRAFT_1184106 [Mycena latifolia]